MNAIFALPENSHLVEPEVPEYLQHLDNIEEQVPAMESHIEGIEVALESMERLIKLRAAFKRSGQPSKTKLKIGLLAIESIQRDTKIIPQGTAVEAFSEENIATEGFGSMISKIIEAIANTFKKLWEWIASFFQEQDKKKTIEEGNEKIKKAQEKIEKRKKEKESGGKPADADQARREEEQAAAALERIIGRFAFLFPGVDLSSLSSHAQECAVSLGKQKELISEFELLNRETSHLVRDFAAASDLDKANVRERVGDILNKYSHDVLTKFKPLKNNKLAAELQDRGAIGSTVRTVFQGTRGKIVLGYQLKALPNETSVNPGIKLEVTDDHSDSEANHKTIDAVSFGQIKTYAEIVRVFGGKIGGFYKDSKNTMGKVTSDQKVVTQALKQFATAHFEDDTILQVYVATIRNLASNLVANTSALVAMTTYVDRTFLDHGEVLLALSAHRLE